MDNEFNKLRPLLFSIAYRMVGSVMDAEDIVQEAFIRWQGAQRDHVESVKSYLCTIVTRLCIDHLRAVQAQRETYIGPWLPEPLFMDQFPTVSETVMRTESLSMAFLVMLEKLSPLERAVFLLREVFEYDYAEIAQIVDKSEAYCRQMLRRAHQHIGAAQPRYQASPQQQEQMTANFVAACANGDLNGLLALLTDDIVAHSDGGGRVSTAINSIVGADHVARYLLGVLKKQPPDFTVRMAQVNGQPAIVGYVSNQPYNITLIGLDSTGKISSLYAVLNPDKLRRVSPLT